MSGPVGSLMRAAFGKSEEMTTGRPEVSGCRQFFVVPNANWNRRHEEMIRIDGERGEFAVNSFYLGRIMEESDARRARASVHHFLPYVHTG